MGQLFKILLIVLISQPGFATSNDTLNGLLKLQPSWFLKTVTSHDFWGGNGDGQFFGGKEITYGGQTFKVIFHEKGEGLVQRFLISALPDQIEKNFRQLIIIRDGIEFYNGPLTEFFSMDYPLTYDIKQSSGSFVSYLPISYQRELIMLMTVEPHFYQVTYREGKGASESLQADELKTFMTEEWWKKSHLQPIKITGVEPQTIAEGPVLVSELEVHLNSPAQVKEVKFLVNDVAIPFGFLFGLGVEGTEENFGLPQVPITSSLNFVDPQLLIFKTRMPIPLQPGDRLSITAPENLDIRLKKTGVPPAGVRFVPQYKDQWGQGNLTTMTLFENKRPTKLISTTMLITDGKVGDQYFLEGEEMIRVDGLKAPYQLGTGTEEYFGGGWYFWNVYSNFFSGLPRRVPEKTWKDEGWKKKVFEHSLYRQHTIDPIVARRGIQFGWEAGDMGQYTPVRYRTLISAYEFDGYEPLHEVVIPVKTDKSVYTWMDGERNLNEKALRLHYRYVNKGVTEFSLKCPDRARAVLVERTFDGGLIDQWGQVFVSGRLSGEFFNGYANSARRFAQDSMWIDLLPADCQKGVVKFTIHAVNWTESEYKATFF